MEEMNQKFERTRLYLPKRIQKSEIFADARLNEKNEFKDLSRKTSPVPTSWRT